MSGKTFITYGNQWRIWLYKWAAFSKRFSTSHNHGLSTHYSLSTCVYLLQKTNLSTIENQSLQQFPYIPMWLPRQPLYNSRQQPTLWKIITYSQDKYP